MSGFVVVRHPGISTPGVIPAAALEHQRARGWFRVSDERAEPAAFHLPEFVQAPDLDATPTTEAPAQPVEDDEEQQA